MSNLKRKQEGIELDFSLSFAPNKHILVELDPHVTEEIEKENTLYLKGGSTTNASLCTSTHTYEIKKSESSNCSLLIPPASDKSDEASEGVVVSSSNFHYELVAKKPDMSSLSLVLSSAEFPDGLSLKDLESMFSASKTEIERALMDQHATLFRNKWKLLSRREQAEVFGSILTTIIANGWNIQHVPQNSLKAEMADTEPDKISMALQPFLEKEQKRQHLEWSLSPTAVSRFRTKEILKNHGTLEMKAFLKEWELSLPLGIEQTTPDFKAIGIIDVSADGLEAVKYLDAEKLPKDPKARFSKLFQKKNKWKLEELTPYVEALVQPKLSMATLLKRFTRVCRERDGSRYYCAR